MHCGTGMSPGLPQPLMLGSGSAWGVHSAALTRRGPISRNSSTAETTGLRLGSFHISLGPARPSAGGGFPLAPAEGRELCTSTRGLGLSPSHHPTAQGVPTSTGGKW